MEEKTYNSDDLRRNKKWIKVRKLDNLVILSTSKGRRWYRTNPTAVKMLAEVLAGVEDSAIVKNITEVTKADPAEVTKDLGELIQLTAELLFNPDSHDELELQAYVWENAAPLTGELTLTRRCNDRCRKCYMSAATEAASVENEPELSLEQIKTIVDRMVEEWGITTMIISGGEPTLRPDICEIVVYIHNKGVETAMITNGILCGTRPGLAKQLFEAGLDSAQVSLDSPIESIHNELVGNPIAYRATVKGLINLKEAGVHAYVNSTVCKTNAESLKGMPQFLKDLGIKTWSTNGLIPSGRGLENAGEIGLTYTQFAPLVINFQKICKEIGLEYVWLLPVPYCILNEPALGLSTAGCTAANGVGITNSKGEYVACNNLPEEVLGNVLDPNQSMMDMYNGEAAKWWRERKWAPLPCEGCVHKATCCGACPLYWTNPTSDMKEIARARGVALPAGYTDKWRAEFEARPRYGKE